MAKPSDVQSSSQNDQETDSSETITISKAELNQLMNSAITARNRSLEAKLEDKFAKFEQLLQGSVSNTSEEKPVSSGKKLSPEMEAMQNQLKMLQEDKARSRDMNLRTQVKQQLLEAGVNPAAVKALVALHVDAEKRVSYASDNSDQIIYKADDSHYDLSQGLQGWLKSDEAKGFLSPKGATGSGDRSYKTNSNNSNPKNLSRQEIGAGLMQAFLGSSPSSDDDE